MFPMSFSRSFCVLSVKAEKTTGAAEGRRDVRRQESCGNHGTLEDSTVSAGAGRHVGEDAMDLLQLFNSNIAELVLTAQKKNFSRSVDEDYYLLVAKFCKF